jgi:hypothetical protein
VISWDQHISKSDFMSLLFMHADGSLINIVMTDWLGCFLSWRTTSTQLHCMSIFTSTIYAYVRAVTELMEGDSSRLKSDRSSVRVHNTQRTLSRFEEYRQAQGPAQEAPTLPRRRRPLTRPRCRWNPRRGINLYSNDRDLRAFAWMKFGFRRSAVSITIWS